jgi:hypothetical protein
MEIEIETLKAMNEGIYFGLLMMIRVILLITAFFAIAGFAIYSACAAWFCFQETRQVTTAPQTARRASLPSAWKPEARAPDERVLVCAATERR